MCSLEYDEMTVLWPNDCIIMSYYCILFIKYQMVQLLLNKFSDWMCSLDCDEMTVLWQKWLHNVVFLLHIIYLNIK